MIKEILNSLTEKIQYLQSFDEKIESLKNKAESATQVYESPADLLKKYKAKIETENDIKVLEGLKAEFIKPDVLDGLSDEFYKNLNEVYSKYDSLKKAELLKKKFLEDLKKIDAENSKMNEEAIALQRQYIDVATKLGYSPAEAEYKMSVHWRESGSRIILREPFYID